MPHLRCLTFVVGLPVLVSKNVRPLVSVMERPNLDQVLSRLREITSWFLLLGTLFPARASRCSLIPTFGGVASAVLALPCDSTNEIVC